jgi:hypothetical protein
VLANTEDERSASDVHDRVINQIFRSGLMLAGILSFQRVDDEVADRLRDVMDALDTAVRELRTAALASLVRDREAQSATPHRAASADGGRRLCRFTVDEVFAYAMRGHDFYRASDHVLWAHETDGLLLSARSGSPFARRVGNVFYDIESNVPLYYEDRHTGPLPAQSSEVSS